uniref:Recep_L_domain domain-containing protein n=1 Tax=Schistosoma curassoni TaxID=6186 RepID=A0A183JKV1_9TREM
MMRILDINDLSIHNRHVGQIQLRELGESVPISVVNSNTNQYILNDTGSISNTQMNLSRRLTINYRNLDSNLSCDACNACMK